MIAERQEILLWNDHAVWGSTETYLARVASGLADGRPERSVTVAAPASQHEAWKSALSSTVQLVARPQGFVRTFRLLHRSQPDVLLVNDPALHALAGARLARVPVVLNIWHAPSLRIQWNWKARATWRYAAANPRSTVVTMSPANQQTHQRNYPHARQRTVVGPGTPMPVVTPEEPWPWKRPAALRAAFVGRFAIQKDLPTLLRAARHAADILHTEGGLQIVLVGDGEERDELEILADQLALDDVVRFVGWRSNPGALVALADAFVMSSSSEGLPFAMLEAMALGQPVVSTAVDGVCDAVDERCAILVPPGDSAALGDALVLLAHDPERRRSMASGASEAYRSRFTVERMVTAMSELVDDLAART